MKKCFGFIILGALVVSFSACSTVNNNDVLVQVPVTEKQYSGKKVLYIDSYNEGYPWSDGIERGISSILGKTEIDYKLFRLDSKRNTEENFIKNRALEAKKLIEDFNPDVLIVSDDNAFKYLVQPYYKDASLPVVFCGLNWDASTYDAPYTNTTGMIEVAPIVELLNHLKPYANGNRIGFLAFDVLTSRKEVGYYKQFFNLELKEVYTKDFSDWKEEYVKIQDEVDILILDNNAIGDWDEKEAIEFVEKNTKIPTGSINSWMSPYVLVALAKVENEFGEWSAQTALNILDGAKPSDIPLVKNKKGKSYANLSIASKLNIALSPGLLKVAEIIK